MLRRFLSVFLILSLLCAEIPAVFAENTEDVSISEAEDEYLEDEVVQDEVIKYRDLVRGDRDGDDSVAIVTLQNRLIELGYLRDSADGIFGQNTEKAIKELQRSNDLEETGTASAELQELLFSGKELISADNSTDPESVSYRVEKTLNMWGFASNVPNGIVNQTTGNGIAEFKKYLRSIYLQAHPTPTPEPTIEPMPGLGFGDAAIAVDVPIEKSAENDVTQEVLDYVSGVYEFDVYTETLSSGDEGDEVARLQRRLYDLNYLATADGEFGANTERALLYFQKKNGLNQSAVADEATQRLLYSDAAVEAEEFVNAYKIIIDVSDQRVYVYQWNGSDYSTYVGEMICSTGLKATPTPLGTYQAAGPTGDGEWYWFKEFKCYAKWATRIVGGILFHSVTYSRGKVRNQTAARKLGKRASHGCIRLKEEHAQWIYENCTPGTTVVVQD